MNPFILSGYQGQKYFCDRLEELRILVEAFENNRNITLSSLRRMGKSALIKFLFEKLRGKADCIYIDILPAANFRELTAITANAVIEFYGNTLKDYLSHLAALIKSINATLHFDENTGKPKIRIGLGEASAGSKNFQEIISFLEKRKNKTLMVFDEFQQVRKFEELNTEAILRSLIQNCKNINFMFLGSNRGMMESIFTDVSKPFYQSTQFMELEEIHENAYKEFILNNFQDGGQKISNAQAEKILKLCRHHTYYVQLLCNRLYSKSFSGKDSTITETMEEILKENEPVYNNYKNLISKVQWKLVKAIAKENGVSEPYADNFITKHRLGPAASVRRALTAMVDKEIITFYKNKYVVYDTFFSLWLNQLEE